MRKTNLAYFTPLVRISIPLTIGILTGHFCHSFFNIYYWMVALLTTWAFALYLNFNKSNRTLFLSSTLYLCIFLLGGTLTHHQHDQQEKAIQHLASEDASILDRALVKAQEIQMNVEQNLKSLHIDEQDLAVVSAMTLGDKSSLSQETKDTYSISGASHILAVSGLHIGIIFQFFILALGGRRHSPITIFISLIVIWAYVFFIQLPPSAVRSTTLVSICSFALLAHRKAISINNLAFAYIVMLCINPLYLFEISFQLSFLAVFSILLITPSLQSLLLPANNKSKSIGTKIGLWLWGMGCMSLAAQIGTMPLIIYYFGRLSTYGLLTSFIAIPAATLILWSATFLLIFYFLNALFAPIAWLSWITYLTSPLVHFASNCLRSITQGCNTALHLCTLIPGASIDGIQINIPQLCLIYLSIAMGYLLWKRIQ